MTPREAGLIAELRVQDDNSWTCSLFSHESVYVHSTDIRVASVALSPQGRAGTVYRKRGCPHTPDQLRRVAETALKSLLAACDYLHGGQVTFDSLLKEGK